MSETKFKPEEFIGYNERLSPEERLKKNQFKLRSTVLITPCYSSGLHPKIAENWASIMAPMNQQFFRMMKIDMEVGAAYSEAIEEILAHPQLSQFKYIATLEHDNIVKPDWLLQLYPALEDDGYDAVGAIYYTKGHGGAPMCYGDHNVMPLNFIPFEPPANSVTRCNGLGMGANIFKLDMFRHPGLSKPFFKTTQSYQEGVGAQAYTQDLKFFENAGKLGFKFACSTKTQVGHMEIGGQRDGFVW